MNPALPYSSPGFEASVDDIRDYAYHLYRQSGCLPGHDLANWLEAVGCLKANGSLHRPDSPIYPQSIGSAPAEAADFPAAGVRAVAGDSASLFDSAAPAAAEVGRDRVKDDPAGAGANNFARAGI